MARTAVKRSLVVGACLAALLASGCTPTGGPSPSPAPTTSAPSPTPTENAQQRDERLAYAAAEKNYRDFRIEYRRVTDAGGARAATPMMEANAAGPYLAEAVKVVRAFREAGGHTQGRPKFGYVRPAGYSPTSLLLDVCEDESSVETFDSKNHQIATNGILVLRLDVRKSGSSWKLWDYSGKEQKSCDE